MLDDIVLFISLYKVKNFKICAESLMMKPSTLSRHILELEEKLGNQLIIRDTKNFEVTDFGTYIYNQFKHLPTFVKSSIHAYNQVHNRNNYHGTLNVALGENIAYELINPYLSDFLKKNPNLKLNICYLPNIVEFPHDGIDIVLSIKHINDKNLDNRFIRKEYIKFYCSNKYAAEHGIPEQIEALNQHLFIAPLNEYNLQIDYVKLKNIHTQDEYVLDIRDNRLNINQITAAHKIGINSDFIFACIEPLVQNDLEQGTVLPVLPNWTLYEFEFYLVTKKHVTEKEQIFIDFIYECMRK